MILGWTPFNKELYKEDLPQSSVVGYCPVIDASPTAMSTVYTLLKRSLSMADIIGQHDVVIVLDQAIYCKAQEILWSREKEFERVVLRLGAFHICCNLLAVLGQRFCDSGLADILVESGTIATGSVASVLNGHHYNRAVRAHKIIYESMLRLKWNAFGIWLQSQTEPKFDQDEIHKEVYKLQKEFVMGDFREFINYPEFKHLQAAYTEFTDSYVGPMARYWQSYLDIVGLLLRFIRSSRVSDWQLHLASIHEMLPWMFAYDHTNYARYLPVYWIEMMNLPDTHPEAHGHLTPGEFAVQRSSGSFNQVPVDQTIEQTINRDSKCPGGIIGFSLNKATVQRWTVTAHERADITKACRELAGLADETSGLHKETTKPRQSNDSKCVQRVVSIIPEQSNPFYPSEHLVSLTSGISASPDVEDDLLEAEKQGLKALHEFVERRINTHQVDFHASITKLKLKTMADMSKNKSSSSKDSTVKSDRDFFARLLVVAQNRNMNLKDVLRYELSAVPCSLAAAVGSLCKDTKSTLSDTIEKGVPALQSYPIGAAWIIDGMALLQSLT